MSFINPFDVVIGGYDIHVYAANGTSIDRLKEVHNELLKYLIECNVKITFSFFYKEKDGPHLLPSFVIHLSGVHPIRDKAELYDVKQAINQLGIVMAWFGLNKKGLDILIHPNTVYPFGHVEEELKDHLERSIWISESRKITDVLSVEVFNNLMKMEPEEVMKLSLENFEKNNKDISF
jgi:hypothetical protein